MKSVTFKIFVQGENGSYGAWCPTLPGCYSVGQTAEEARTRMAEAMSLHMATLMEHEETASIPAAADTVRVEELEFTIGVTDDQ